MSQVQGYSVDDDDLKEVSHRQCDNEGHPRTTATNVSITSPLRNNGIVIFIILTSNYNEITIELEANHYNVIDVKSLRFPRQFGCNNVIQVSELAAVMRSRVVCGVMRRRRGGGARAWDRRELCARAARYRTCPSKLDAQFCICYYNERNYCNTQKCTNNIAICDNNSNTRIFYNVSILVIIM